MRPGLSTPTVRQRYTKKGFLLRETLKHREAFEYYYSLGEKRNLSLVAQEYGVNLRAVKKWSVAFNWQGRVEQRDIEIGRRLQEKTNDTIVVTKANYRKIIKAAIGRWVQKFKIQQIDPDSVLDLERLVKLDLLLMGEATERSEYGTDIDWREKLLGELDRLAARRGEREANQRSQSEGS